MQQFKVLTYYPVLILKYLCKLDIFIIIPQGKTKKMQFLMPLKWNLLMLCFIYKLVQIERQWFVQ